MFAGPHSLLCTPSTRVIRPHPPPPQQVKQHIATCTLPYRPSPLLSVSYPSREWGDASYIIRILPVTMPAIIRGVRRLLTASVQVYGMDKTLFYLHVYSGRILGRNWGKSLKSFPPCKFTVISTNRFSPSPSPLSKSGLKLVCFVNIVQYMSEKSQDYAQKPSTKLYIHEFGFRLRPGGISQPEQSGEELLPNLSLRNKTHGKSKSKENRREVI